MDTRTLASKLRPYEEVIRLAEAGTLTCPPVELPDGLRIEDPIQAVKTAVRLAQWSDNTTILQHISEAVAPKKRQPVYDSTAGSDFLRTLFPPTTTGLIELRAKTADGPVRKFWLRPDQIGEEADWVSRMDAKGWPVWVGIAPRKSTTGGDTENLLPPSWLWVDLDFKLYPNGEAEARDILSRYKLQPTILVESGGGLHAYWRVETFSGLNWCLTCKGKLQALAKALKADTQAAEPARVMRLPGTHNSKYDPPILVRRANSAALALF